MTDIIKCGCTGCENEATHTWSGHPTCDSCGTPSSSIARLNKQELIDKVVNELKGILPENHVDNPYFIYLDAVCVGPSHSFKSICRVKEFTQRAKELGWINGYQYGVEYPTNGEKPDLPAESLKLYLKNRHFDTVVQACDSNFVKWENVKSFRIVDERYKPKDHTAHPHDMVDNSWYERGDLPPVGVECEISN